LELRRSRQEDSRERSHRPPPLLPPNRAVTWLAPGRYGSTLPGRRTPRRARPGSRSRLPLRISGVPARMAFQARARERRKLPGGIPARVRCVDPASASRGQEARRWCRDALPAPAPSSPLPTWRSNGPCRRRRVLSRVSPSCPAGSPSILPACSPGPRERRLREPARVRRTQPRRSRDSSRALSYTRHDPKQ